MSATLALGAAGSVAGVMAVKEILNWVVPLKYQPRISASSTERQSDASRNDAGSEYAISGRYGKRKTNVPVRIGG